MKRKGRKYGGVTASDGTPTLISGNPNVVSEAKERKKGGRVGKDCGDVAGKKSAMRLDRPGRKSGGRVGADSSPLSSANKTSNAPGHDASEEG
jgi:hypothetical protein